MRRYLTGRAFTLSHQFLDDETTLAPASVTVTVYPDGSDASVFSGAASEVDDVWSVSVPARTQGVYRVKWDGGATAVDYTYFEVVGRHLFSIPQARAIDEALTALDYPTATVRETREKVENEFERITGRAFVPRTRSITFTSDEQHEEWLGVFDVAEVLSVTVDGAAEADLSEWVFSESGWLEYPDTVAAGATVVVTVDYGFRSPPPDVSEAGLIRCRDLLVASNSGIPDRATSFIADNGGQYMLATPGARGWETGIPAVDVVLKRYRYDIVFGMVGA